MDQSEKKTDSCLSRLSIAFGMIDECHIGGEVSRFGATRYTNVECQGLTSVDLAGGAPRAEASGIEVYLRRGALLFELHMAPTRSTPSK